jgi:HK97 family phage portal protein
MSLVKNLLRRRTETGNELSITPRIEERSGTPGAGLSLTAFLGWSMEGGDPTASGEIVNAATALQNATVQTCVRVISDGVSTLPCKLYQNDGTGRKQLFTPLSRMLLSCPNDEMTAITFWSCLTASLALTGNCFAEIERNGAGQPVALWPLNPNLTHARRDMSTNSLYYETTDGLGMGNSTPRKINSQNMFHVPLFSWDGVEGFSPIRLARQGIGLAKASENFGARFFGNGSRPSGLLTPTDVNISPEAMESARRTWQETQSGTKQGSTAVLPGDWKYTPLSISPEDSQFIQVRQFQRQEICAIFGVPVSKAGDTSKSSKASSEQEALSFVTDTLQPYFSRLEAEICRKLINDPSVFAQFDFSERLRTDIKSTYDAIGVGRQWGILTANDAREMLGMNLLPDDVGDILWAPVNMQNAELLLATESIQDQPVGTKPPVEPNTQLALPAPQAETKMLGKYTTSFVSVFRDGYQRLANRQKRDVDAVQQVLGPVLRSIAQLSLSDALEQHGLDKVSDEIETADIVNLTCRNICKRMEGVTATNCEESAQKEFIKSIRAIYINTHKEIAAAVAASQLSEETDAE